MIDKLLLIIKEWLQILFNIRTEIWAIIISFIAIILTLLKDFIQPAFFKPRITIKGLDDGECVQNGIDGLNTNSRWVSLRLINQNSFWSRPAINCYVKLLEIRDSDNVRIQPFNTTPLIWVTYGNTKNNLAKGEYHLINLVHEIPENRILHFNISIPRLLHKMAEDKLGAGTYTFKIGVYGDNFSPVFEDFKVRLTKQFGELNFI
jgi:hypothetical protein